eukprot:21605-Pyramimonas_sp.AAC.1
MHPAKRTWPYSGIQRSGKQKKTTASAGSLWQNIVRTPRPLRGQCAPPWAALAGETPPGKPRSRAIETAVPEGPTGGACHAKRVGGLPYRVEPALAPMGPAIGRSEGIDVPLGPQL